MPTIGYQECLTWMYGLRRFGIKLELDTIKHILKVLGNPHKMYRSIHIAGTNGKGSVAAMLSTIFHTAGYRVGRYTSPHLERFNERICIDNQPIDDEAVLRAYQQVKAINHPFRQPTFFEFTTAMALLEFGRRKVDWAIIETGMGGRMDATNVIQPALTIITNISLEHKQYLGSTIGAIAFEKAGIIKTEVPLVTGVHQKGAFAIIDQKAAQHKATVLRKGRNFHTRCQGGNRFSYYGINQSWRNLQLNLAGAHQVDNAAMVLAACEFLVRSGQVHITESHIRKGLQRIQWPGRLEIAGVEPHIILDGAHNLMAARVLAKYLMKRFKGMLITLVVGILEDKPYRAILKDLALPCHRIIVTQPKIERAISAEKLAILARQLCPNVEVVADVGQAIQHAIETSRTDDVICVAGSLYVVGEAKSALAGTRDRHPNI